jgi:hypothetical protein
VFGCKKEKEEEIGLLKGQFLIDSLTYNSYGTDMYYRIGGKDGNPPYHYQWLSPSDNKGNGPFHLRIKDTYEFTALINDSRYHVDAIRYFYDYRDKVIGQYNCVIHYSGYAGEDSSYIDTIAISKSEPDMISLVSISFSLDSVWRFYGSFYQKHHVVSFSFSPKEDSFYFGIYDGPLGGPNMHYEYRGIKIKD